MSTALRTVGHDDRLSLVEHLTELRVRLMISLLAFVAATVLCMWQNQRVLDILNKPLTQTQQKGNSDPIQEGAGFNQLVARWVRDDAALLRAQAAATKDPVLRAAILAHAQQGERLSKLAPKVQARKPVTLGVSEPFMETLKVSMYAGLLLSLPLILYQLYAFVLPAFSPREKQVALPAMLGVPFLFIGGVVFGYYTVVPRAIFFLQNFNTDAFDVSIQAQPYYKFSLIPLIGRGLLSKIPIPTPAPTRAGIVPPSQREKNRRYAILGI